MNGFEGFIYMLGAITFAVSLSGGALYLVHLIEHPRWRK